MILKIFRILPQRHGDTKEHKENLVFASFQSTASFEAISTLKEIFRFLLLFHVQVIYQAICLISRDSFNLERVRMIHGQECPCHITSQNGSR